MWRAVSGMRSRMAVSGAGPAKIFISYRRADADWPARWLADRLAGQFGTGVVFQDVDSIRPGDDFAVEIEAAVGSCSVLLALIGPRWLAAESGTGRRLDDPQDWVRLEIEAAIRRRVRVIPVLLDGARMPVADELPPSLRKLVRRQAVTLSPASLDIRRLVSALHTALLASAAEERSSARTRVAEAKAVVDPERARAIARSIEDVSPSLRASTMGIPEEGLVVVRRSGSRALRDARSDADDVSFRAEREAEIVLAKARAYAMKIKSDAQARAQGLERDADERHRQAMVFLAAYSDSGRASEVLSLAQQMCDQLIAYGRREAAKILADARAQAEDLERDAQDRQGQVKASVAAQNDETDAGQQVLSLARQTADQAIADARREAAKIVADAQARAEGLDQDVRARQRLAMASVAASEGEMDTAERVLSLARETVDQAIADARREAARTVADARHEAARTVADAQTRTVSLVARHTL